MIVTYQEKVTLAMVNTIILKGKQIMQELTKQTEINIINPKPIPIAWLKSSSDLTPNGNLPELLQSYLKKTISLQQSPFLVSVY